MTDESIQRGPGHNPIKTDNIDWDQKLHSVKLDFQNIKLYGREKEIETLHETYYRSMLKKVDRLKKDVVFVYGYSGVGKTALVETLRGEGAIMVAGKFDQTIRSEPFSAVVEALSELGDFVLTYNSSKLRVLREKLEASFAKKQGEIEAICNLVPRIRNVLGLQESPRAHQLTKLDYQSRSIAKLTEGCQIFLRVVCNSLDNGSVILFIDDLQWSDVASLELIKEISTDVDNNGLLFVGAYRDNEVDNVHPLAIQLHQMEAQGSVNCIQLYIGDLDLVSVNKVIADAMHSNSMEPLKDLAKIVYMKTEGNAFFVIQFLRSLQNNGLLFFSMESFVWVWDAATIETETAICKNIVDFMASKIQLLPPDVIEVIKLGSCLGRRFDTRLIAKVMNKMFLNGTEQHQETDTTHLVALMDVAIAEGLINPAKRPGRFVFAHDRIQQAAYSLFLPDISKRSASHLCIGRVYKSQLDASTGDHCHQSDWLILAAAEQLNMGSEIITDQAERAKLARLNLKAAQLAVQKSAFFPSKTFLEAGLSMLDTELKWIQNYDLSLEMTILLARMQYATGSRQECKKSVDEVLRHARTMGEKMPVYIIEIEALGSEGSVIEAIEIALNVLNELGEPFPRKPGRLHIFWDKRRVQKLLRGRSNDDLLATPEVIDEDKRAAMDILRILSVFAIVTAQRNFIVLLQARQMKLALMHGVSKCTPMACANWGYFKANTGNWEEGSRLGLLSEKFLDRFTAHKDIHAEALKLNHVYLNHLKRPIHDSLDPMFRAYQVGMETGDIKNAAFAANLYLDMYFWCGLPLNPIVQDAKGFRDEMTRYKQEVPRDFVAIKYQCILNFLGRSRDPLELVGLGVDEEKLMKTSLTSKTFWVAQHIRLMRVVLAYHLGDAFMAWERAEEFIDNDTDAWGVEYMTGPNCFILSLSAMGVLKVKRNRKIERKSLKYIQKVASWASKGEVNATHLNLILLAEKAAISMGKYEVVKDAYDTAIKSAARGGFLQNAALTCERTAEFLLSRGKKDRAEDYLVRSYEFYQEWGAVAKLKQLRFKYRLFESSVIEDRRGTSRYGYERFSLATGDMHRRSSSFGEFEESDTDFLGISSGHKPLSDEGNDM